MPSPYNPTVTKELWPYILEQETRIWLPKGKLNNPCIRSLCEMIPFIQRGTLTAELFLGALTPSTLVPSIRSQYSNINKNHSGGNAQANEHRIYHREEIMYETAYAHELPSKYDTRGQWWAYNQVIDVAIPFFKFIHSHGPLTTGADGLWRCPDWTDKWLW